MSCGLYIKPSYLSMEIPSSHLKVLAEIDQICTKYCECWARNSHFEKRFGLSDKTVTKALRALREGGLITKNENSNWVTAPEQTPVKGEKTSGEETPAKSEHIPAGAEQTPVATGESSPPSKVELKQELKEKTISSAAKKAERKASKKQEAEKLKAGYFRLLKTICLETKRDIVGEWHSYTTWYKLKPTIITAVAFLKFHRDVAKASNWNDPAYRSTLVKMFASEAWKMARPKLEATVTTDDTALLESIMNERFPVAPEWPEADLLEAANDLA
jgi:DNA-binding transcriptional ArsR family regulator